jgi:hypothetical protein
MMDAASLVIDIPVFLDVVRDLGAAGLVAVREVTPQTRSRVTFPVVVVGAAGAAEGLAVHGQGAARAPAGVVRRVGWSGAPGADRRVEGIAVDARQAPALGGPDRGGGPGGFSARAS